MTLAAKLQAAAVSSRAHFEAAHESTTAPLQGCQQPASMRAHMRECAAFALTIFANDCAAHTGRHVTRDSAGSNTAPATHVQLATNVSSFISAAYTLRSSPATPRSAPAPAAPTAPAAPATLVTLRCSFARLSATPTPAQHLVTQRKPGGSA
jgi:hypothetical protein